MLTCRELAHRHASDYVDGQLGWRARLSVRFHLLICDHCRRFLAQLRQVRKLLRAKPLNNSFLDPSADPAATALGLRLAEIYTAQKNSSPPL